MTDFTQGTTRNEAALALMAATAGAALGALLLAYKLGQRGG